jgi:hypothetical protein
MTVAESQQTRYQIGMRHSLLCLLSCMCVTMTAHVQNLLLQSTRPTIDYRIPQQHM